MAPNADLPQLICNECALHLNVACNFKKKILNSEKLLLDMLAETAAAVGSGVQVDQKRPPPPIVVQENGGGGGSAMAAAATSGGGGGDLETVFETEQKPFPPDQHQQVDSEDEGPQVKYVMGDLLSHYANNQLIVLSDTDSDDTEEEMEIIDQRLGNSSLLQPVPDAQLPFECPVCPQRFPESFLLTQHVNQHQVKKCKLCDRQPLHTSVLLLHFTTHSQKLIDCSHCPYQARSAQSLRNHMRVHKQSSASNRAYQCNTCERFLPSLERIRIHLILDHKINVRSDSQALQNCKEMPRSSCTQCRICNRQLSNFSCLRVHMKLHERDALNVCYVCQTSFRQDQSMYVHFRQKHPGLKPYRCSGHCERTFDTLRHYDMHMRDVRSNQSKTSATAAVEFNNSNPIPPEPTNGRDCAAANGTKKRLECMICDQVFSDENDQMGHIKTAHRRLICKKCKQEYVKVRSLLDHYDNYHPNGHWTGMFECRTCGKEFPTTRSVSNHERSHRYNAMSSTN